MIRAVQQHLADTATQRHVLATLGVNVDSGIASMEQQVQEMQAARKKARAEVRVASANTSTTAPTNTTTTSKTTLPPHVQLRLQSQPHTLLSNIHPPPLIHPTPHPTHLLAPLHTPLHTFPAPLPSSITLPTALPTPFPTPILTPLPAPHRHSFFTTLPTHAHKPMTGKACASA